MNTIINNDRFLESEKVSIVKAMLVRDYNKTQIKLSLLNGSLKREIKITDLINKHKDELLFKVV